MHALAFLESPVHIQGGTRSKGSIVLTIPDFADSQLVFDDMETRQILVFFWPERSAGITGLAVSNNVRRLAQTARVAAIEGSYAMGFIEQTFKSASSGPNVAKWGWKLATGSIGHIWRHAKSSDLRKLRLYESVRRRVAQNLSSEPHMFLHGLNAGHRGTLQFHLPVDTVQA